MTDGGSVTDTERVEIPTITFSHQSVLQAVQAYAPADQLREFIEVRFVMHALASGKLVLSPPGTVKVRGITRAKPLPFPDDDDARPDADTVPVPKAKLRDAIASLRVSDEWPSEDLPGEDVDVLRVILTRWLGEESR